MREFSAMHGLPDDVVYKEVVVIGNGPSGICMSHQLAGYWAHLSPGAQPHPEPMLAARLASSPSGRALPAQPLRRLAEGLEGRSRNPLPLLVDCLMHPGADMGLDLPSMLDWKYYPEKQIDHVVLGKGRAGGCWHALDESVLTLSPARWMALPQQAALPGLRPEQRAPVPAIAAYLERYVRQLGLQRFFRNHTLVTSVKPINWAGQTPCEGPGCPSAAAWCVCGYDSAKKEPFRYVCSRVVLATGASDKPNTLPGGAADGAIWTPTRLRAALLALPDGDVGNMAPVLVVGSGLSAADAILRLLARGLPVIHAYRGPSAALRALPPALYPEYHQVHQMMKDGTSGDYPLYQARPDHVLVQMSRQSSEEEEEDTFHRQDVKMLNTKDGKTYDMEVSLCVVLIGSRPDLHFIPDDFESNYLTLNLKSESLKPEVLTTNVNRKKIQEHAPEKCIKCSYNKSVDEKSQENGLKTCFLKTQWFNFSKYLSGQTMYKSVEKESTKTNDLSSDDVFRLGKKEGKSALDFKASDFLGEGGLGLGIDPEKSIDSRTNPIHIDKETHAVLNAPKGMYALGPLTGDNFVRFIPGGALAILSDIWKEKKTEENCLNQECQT